MDGREIKKMMEQIHITGEMQERIIADLQNGLENGKGKAWDWKWIAVFAAAFILGAGIISIPVRAIVQDIVRARMESIPEEEMNDISEQLQKQKTEAESLSREYTAAEEERCKELWQAYKKGRFPHGSLRQVDTPEEAPAGELCYIYSTGEFCLPERELTDEEHLEIIDFRHKKIYAVSQSEAAQEARAEMEAEQKKLRQRVQAAGGISEAQALEAAMDYIKSGRGVCAEEMLLEMIDLKDNGDQIVYFIVYGNEDKSTRIFLEIDSADGSILKAD